MVNPFRTRVVQHAHLKDAVALGSPWWLLDRGTTFGNKKTYPSSMAVILYTNDYPFGMVMPGRTYTATTGYRYGFNGQEKDGDLNESITTALYWEYDSRIGRRWNVDPDERTDESPYLTFGGNPLLHSDPQGNFWITDHLAIDREAYRMVYAGR